MDDIQEMTRKAQEAMQGAATLAEQRQASAVEAEHLFSQLLTQADGIVPSLIKNVGGDLGLIEREVEKAVSSAPQVSGAAKRVIASPKLVKLFSQAEAEARALGDEYISTEHFLLAALKGAAPDVARWLAQGQVT